MTGVAMSNIFDCDKKFGSNFGKSSPRINIWVINPVSKSKHADIVTIMSPLNLKVYNNADVVTNNNGITRLIISSKKPLFNENSTNRATKEIFRIIMLPIFRILFFISFLLKQRHILSESVYSRVYNFATDGFQHDQVGCYLLIFLFEERRLFPAKAIVSL